MLWYIHVMGYITAIIKMMGLALFIFKSLSHVRTIGTGNAAVYLPGKKLCLHRVGR